MGPAQERSVFMEGLKASPSEFATRIVSSPKRSLVEPTIEAEYAKALAHFGGTFPRDWHRSNLRDIAGILGLREEYDVMIRLCNAATHGSPLNMKWGPIVQPQQVGSWRWEIVFRVMDANARYHALDLSARLKESFKTVRANRFV